MMKMTRMRGWSKTIGIRPSTRGTRREREPSLGPDDNASLTPVPHAVWRFGARARVGESPLRLLRFVPTSRPRARVGESPLRLLRFVPTSRPRASEGEEPPDVHAGTARARAGGVAPVALVARASRPSGRTSPLAFAWTRLLHTYAIHLDPPIARATLHVLPTRAYFRIYAPLTTNDARASKDTRSPGETLARAGVVPIFFVLVLPRRIPCRRGCGVVDAVSDSVPLPPLVSYVSHCTGADGDNEDDGTHKRKWTKKIEIRPSTSGDSAV
ncbi:hypothetical protein B0H14DRAFT_587643 [Mycena olivaceomarginata]|nr:hypothetical protein B0H14DRAFT_587643 [Mycena olivaceomarginata]